MSVAILHLLCASTLPTTGQFFIEIFCGTAALTLGLMLSRVPCLKPWDSKYGEQFDVLAEGWILLQLIQAGVIVSAHFGTPCKSLTWARWPCLRSWDFPLGLPGLGPHARDLVDTGNDLMAFTWQCCMELMCMHAYFSVENPERSWLWYIGNFMDLSQLDGVAFARFLFRNFGVPFFKPTLALHNTPTLHLLRVPVLPWPGETISLRGKVWWNGKLAFRTQVAEAYPPALASKYGELMAQALDQRSEAH